MTSPWDSIQEYDVQRLGSDILDPREQERWCRAVFMAGSLPFMWRESSVVRDLVYDRMELASGDSVLVIGEGVEACGFGDDLRDKVGSGGVHVVDIIEEARDRYLAGIR